MTVEQDIINFLLDSSPVAAVVGARVYPMTVQQGVSRPCIVVGKPSGGPLYADEGEIGLSNPQIEIFCQDVSYGAAKSLASVVRGELSAFSGGRIHSAFLDDERDEQEAGSNSAEYLYTVTQTYRVWHEDY